MGPLSDIEKLAIDGMVSKGIDIKQIKKTLGRGDKSKVVEKYLETAEVSTSKYDKNAVMAKLSAAGLDYKTSTRLLDRALKALEGEELTTTSVYNEAIRSLGPRELMINKTESGAHDGNVTIMTPEAANFSDKTPISVRNTPDYVFKPND